MGPQTDWEAREFPERHNAKDEAFHPPQGDEEMCGILVKKDPASD